MSVQSVAEQFESYRKGVLPADAPPIQIEECRRAFFAGAYGLLMNVMNYVGDDSVSEDQGVIELEQLKAECEIFAATLSMAEEPVARPATTPDARYTTSDAAEFRPLLHDLGGKIGSMLPDGWGFMLMIFSYQPGSLFYISSAEREDVIGLMQNFIKKNRQ